MHHMTNDEIRYEQNKILFRGNDSNTKARHVSDEALNELRQLNIEMIKNYMPDMNSEQLKRALRTISNIKLQMSK